MMKIQNQLVKLTLLSLILSVASITILWFLPYFSIFLITICVLILLFGYLISYSRELVVGDKLLREDIDRCKSELYDTLHNYEDLALLKDELESKLEEALIPESFNNTIPDEECNYLIKEDGEFKRVIWNKEGQYFKYSNGRVVINIEGLIYFKLKDDV